ncbi:hypothetical protein J2T56_000325 [Natronobacillus azotifigens]|uniref:DUF6123 family protein n=1 Tax=Natronobacillus azotifigens TaxID=472978 RepID=A0A9J6R9F0_9BACI|nr:DUF6123 family protein [Natronobacillus azotifigens]MCZ0701900.1 DUF6123 family protein [Natronobacillus azotifigens]
MKNDRTLADYIEHLWVKGFKLTDEQVHFIYFGKQYTNASDKLVRIALETTLRIQYSFDGSFYISLLELLKENNIITIAQAKKLFHERGIK